MRRCLVMLVCFLLFAGCDRKPAIESKAALPSLPVVAIEDVPAPATRTVRVERGQNLRSIGSMAYGHERFSGFVAVVNGISDPERVSEGAELKTPSLSMAFRDTGMDPAYQPIFNTLAKACTDYYKTEPAYLSARQASGVERGNFPIPADIQTKLVASADAIDAGVASLSAVTPPTRCPKWRSASSSRQLSTSGNSRGDRLTAMVMTTNWSDNDSAWPSPTH